MTKTNTVWCLFSVDNNYDQPPNNLEGFWFDKPSLETVAKALGRKFPAETDEVTLKIVKLWGGESVLLIETSYRLEEVKEGAMR